VLAGKKRRASGCGQQSVITVLPVHHVGEGCQSQGGPEPLKVQVFQHFRKSVVIKLIQQYRAFVRTLDYEFVTQFVKDRHRCPIALCHGLNHRSPYSVSFARSQDQIVRKSPTSTSSLPTQYEMNGCRGSRRNVSMGLDNNSTVFIKANKSI